MYIGIALCFVNVFPIFGLACDSETLYMFTRIEQTYIIADKIQVYHS